MPTIYKSTDASAPVLTGQVNSLVNVLDKCLVAGYGSKTAAGWTKPYTGTNQAVFLQGGSGVLKYFQIDDNGPGAGLAKEARIWGFETMTAYNTGTGQFPAAATARVLRKSATADATARDWIVAADGKTAHVFISTGDKAAVYFSFSFGDLYSWYPGDLWKGYIVARSTENSASTSVEWLYWWQTNALTGLPGMTLQRSYTGFGGFINATCGNAGGNGLLCFAVNAGSTNGVGSGGVSFPNPPDGDLLLHPLRIFQTPSAPGILRGRYRGLYHQMHTVASFNDQDTFSGINEFAGKTFLMIKSVGNPFGPPEVSIAVV